MADQVEGFSGAAGDLYHRYRKQKSHQWRRPRLIIAVIAAIVVLDLALAWLFTVDAVSGAYWSDDGRHIVYTKAVGSAIDYATDAAYRKMGGDEVWVYDVMAEKSKKVVERIHEAHMAPYQVPLEGGYVWMTVYGRKSSRVEVFPLKDPLSVLSWKFEGLATDLLMARGRKALVCRDRGDVGFLEIGEPPWYVHHASGPYTLRGQGVAGMTAQGARAFYAEKTPKTTNIYVWDKTHGKPFTLASLKAPLLYLSNDALGKYPTYVVRVPGSPSECELWVGDTVSGKIRLLYKSKNGFQAFRWSPDERFAAFASMTKLVVFEPRAAVAKQVMASFDALGTRSVAFTPDSGTLLYNVGTSLYALALSTGQVTKMPAEIPPFAYMSLSPDGSRLLLRTSLECPGALFGLSTLHLQTGELKTLEGASPAHLFASSPVYRGYVAIRNFLTGRKKRAP